MEAGQPTETITYAQVCDWDNLWRAWRKAAFGKRGRPAAATFEYRLEDHLVTLQEELINKTYRPGGYASFTIHEPKRRLRRASLGNTVLPVRWAVQGL